YLNVTAPARADDLPVIVWIHPADMMFGSGDVYGADRLAKDAVVVTPNYRLGAMGFLTDPSLDSGSVNGSGSLGVEDQQAALRWVERNIEAFGGDAGNVTIMGESGGGYGVCDQLASPKAAGLFDRAIIQSAPCGAGGGSRTRAAAIDDSEAVVKAALATEQCAGLDTATCLRTVDAQTLVDAYGAWGSPRPVSGTPLLPLPVEEALRTGEFNRVPVLIGVNHDEANGMIGGMELQPGATPIPPEGYREQVEQYFGAENADRVMAKYPLSAYGNSAGLALSTALTDRDWALATHDTATTLATWTRTHMFELARQETPWFNGYPVRPSFPVWSQHMAELPYIFDMRVTPGVDFFEPLSAEQARLGERMIATWTRFAETGNPGWDRVRGTDANVRSIKPGRWCETEFVRDHELAFWRSL
ncbi:MAG TPA: carboxylesterase family protein, partial [Phytomonospora sp.]